MIKILVINTRYVVQRDYTSTDFVPERPRLYLIPTDVYLDTSEILHRSEKKSSSRVHSLRSHH